MDTTNEPKPSISDINEVLRQDAEKRMLSLLEAYWENTVANEGQPTPPIATPSSQASGSSLLLKLYEMQGSGSVKTYLDRIKESVASHEKSSDL